MSKKPNYTLLGILLASLVAGVMLATSSCSTNPNDSSIRSINDVEPVEPIESINNLSEEEHITSSQNSINNFSSGSQNFSSEEELPSYELPVEFKQRPYKLNNLNSTIIHELFERMFKELPTISSINKDLASENIIESKKLLFKCPICFEDIQSESSFYTNGELIFTQNHSHFDKKIEIDLAEVFLDYINKDTAVLIGSNYKYDFGITKKNNKWYFQLVGLNIPLFKNEIDIRTETLLDSFGDTLIEGTMNLNGPGFDLTKYNTINEENLKNAIPLLFYKHFANVLVEYNCIEASQKLVDEAKKDVSTYLNYKYVNQEFTSSENIDILKSVDYENYNLLGDCLNTSFGGNYYKTDYNTFLNDCFIEMFKEANPGFTNTEQVYIENNRLFIDNKDNSEGANRNYGIFLNETQNFFPMFNEFEIYPGHFTGAEGEVYGDNPGYLYYATDLAKVANIAGNQVNTAEFYEDSYSIKTNIEDYFFHWTLTDSYYFILDYLTLNCYLKSAKLLYLDTYNTLTKDTSIIDESVLVKNTVADDPTADSVTTLYGVVDKQKMLNGQVVKMGFEIDDNGVISIHETTNYTTSVTIDNVTYNDSNSFYFYKDFSYQETIKARFFVEYNDHIEYSKWR